MFVLRKSRRFMFVFSLLPKQTHLTLSRIRLDMIVSSFDIRPLGVIVTRNVNEECNESRSLLRRLFRLLRADRLAVAFP